MSSIGALFNSIFLIPVINILVLIIHALVFFHVPGTLGLAIILLTIFIRLVTYPLTYSQLKMSQKMQELTPHLSKLKEKHKNDSQKLQIETMKLYKEHGANPAAGCLPTLLQIPLIWGLYQAIFILFNEKSAVGSINKLLYPFISPLAHIPDPYFLGINLIHKPSEFTKYGWVLLLVPIITALLQFLQAKMMAPAPLKPYPSDSPKEKKEKSQTQDAMSAMQSQMTFLTPILIGYFSWQFPVGLALYWNTFTIFGILQQYHVQGRDSLRSLQSILNPWLKKKTR